MRRIPRLTANSSVKVNVRHVPERRHCVSSEVFMRMDYPAKLDCFGLRRFYHCATVHRVCHVKVGRGSWEGYVDSDEFPTIVLSQACLRFMPVGSGYYA